MVRILCCWIYFTLLSPESVLLTPPRNLQSFNSLVLGNVPLFQTETILTAPEIILHPNANEIDKMCVHCVRNCVEMTKVRAGVCVISQVVPGCGELGPPAVDRCDPELLNAGLTARFSRAKEARLVKSNVCFILDAGNGDEG